jgi:hypothetical protein
MAADATGSFSMIRHGDYSTVQVPDDYVAEKGARIVI